MLVDLERLKVFYFVFSQKSVVGAARELHITQSAVSQRLKKLEQELGVLLFTRLHKRLVPTGEGQRLYEWIAPFIEGLEEGLHQIRRARDVPGGWLRVGAPVEFGQRVLPPIFAAFRALYPEVRFQLELGHPNVLLPLVQEGKLDVTFVDIFSQGWSHPSVLSSFNITPVFAEALVLIGSAEYCEAWNVPCHCEDPHLLLESSFIAYKKEAPSIKSWFAHHFASSSMRQIQLDLALVVESVRAAITAVKHNMGLAIIPSQIVENEIQSGEMVQICTSVEPILNRISIVQYSDSVPTLTQKKFVHFCMASLEQEKS